MLRSNPMFDSVNINYDSISTDRATYSGITIKTLILLGIAGLAGILAGVFLTRSEYLPLFYGLLIFGAIIEFITVIVGRSHSKYAKLCGIIYSIIEGMLLGTITALANMYYEGVAVLAVAGTGLVFVVCVIMFSCGMMRDTRKLSKIGIVLLLSLLLSTLMIAICNAFNIGGVGTLISNSTGIAILVTVGFIVFASIMLFLNFNEAAYYVQSGATKDFEWIAAFGFLVSILYIYFEVLRLAVIILDRKN